MGEVAEDMIDGTCCSYCGQYFCDPKKLDDNDQPMLYTHGYPVVCNECYDPSDPTYQKSQKPTL